MSARGFLDSLREAADAATVAEKGFRREAAERIKALEEERTFAFRRLNAMRPVVEAVIGAESEEIGVASGVAVLRARLGWVSDSESRSAVLQRFGTVAKAAFAGRDGGSAASATDVAAALADFEAWYAATYAVPFWALFEQPVAETPLVDF
jgi:hypothetical protein